MTQYAVWTRAIIITRAITTQRGTIYCCKIANGGKLKKSQLLFSRSVTTRVLWPSEYWWVFFNFTERKLDRTFLFARGIKISKKLDNCHWSDIKINHMEMQIDKKFGYFCYADEIIFSIWHFTQIYFCSLKNFCIDHHYHLIGNLFLSPIT